MTSYKYVGKLRVPIRDRVVLESRSNRAVSVLASWAKGREGLPESLGERVTLGESWHLWLKGTAGLRAMA